MREQQTSSLQKSVSGLAYSAAGMAVLFLIPNMIRWFRGDVASYLGHDLGQDIAMVGSWIFIVLAVFFIFFALSMLLQFFVRLLFRASSRRSGGY